MIAEPLANPIVRKLLIYIAAFVVGAGAIIAIDSQGATVQDPISQSRLDRLIE